MMRYSAAIASLFFVFHFISFTPAQALSREEVHVSASAFWSQAGIFAAENGEPLSAGETDQDSHILLSAGPLLLHAQENVQANDLTLLPDASASLDLGGTLSSSFITGRRKTSNSKREASLPFMEGSTVPLTL